MRLLQTLFLLAALSLVQGQDSIQVGVLPTLAHSVSGVFYVDNAVTFRIENFTYDGQGPDAFIYYYPPGISPEITGGGIDIPFNTTTRTFPLGRRFNRETVVFPLPPGVKMCDIGNITIWCRYANQFFTIIEIPPSIFTTNRTLAYETPGLIACEPTPGTLIGNLPTEAHGVSGTFYVVNNNTLLIENFNYDGRGPVSKEPFYNGGITSADLPGIMFVEFFHAFLYYYYPGETPVNSGGGIIIPISATQMKFTLGREYTNESLRFRMPAGQYACDMGYFTIWCRQANQFFTRIRIPGDLFTNNPLVANYNRSKILCNTRYTRPGVYVGELPNLAHSTMGTFYVVDNKTLFIQLFHYDGRGPDTFLYWYPAGQQPNAAGGGSIIPISATQEAFPVGQPYVNQDFTITLPDNVSACDINYFTIWCRQARVFFTMIQIPTEIFSNNYDTARANENLVYCLNQTDRMTGATPTAGASLTTSIVTYLTAALFVLAAVIFRV